MMLPWFLIPPFMDINKEDGDEIEGKENPFEGHVSKIK